MLSWRRTAGDQPEFERGERWLGDCASGREVRCGMKVARVVVKVMARRSSVVSSWRAILFFVMC